MKVTATASKFIKSTASLHEAAPSNIGGVVLRPGFSSHHAKLTASLTSLQRGLEITARPDLAPYVHWKNNGQEPIHRWLKYREAYSPELIDKLSLGKRILDPFSGCGSIMIGAATRGRTSLGVDLNPVATFSARVKLTPLSAKQLSAVKSFVNDLARHSLCGRWPVSELSIAEKVFEPEILDVLLRLRQAIRNESGETR